MDAKLDYLSFTILCDLRGEGDLDVWLYYVKKALLESGHSKLLEMLAPLVFEQRGKRGHYGMGLYFPTVHVSIWFGGIANHILVELAGVSCQALRNCGIERDVVRAAQRRCTRLDVAVDIPDFGSPKDFVSAGYNGRFKSRASMTSASGDTEYVGGLKSDRFARVYCYAPPHPRAGVTRVEHVLRNEYAKTAAGMFADDGIQSLVAACGNVWGWQHEQWKPEIATAGELKARRSDTHGAGTLRWIYNAVVPALVRAHRSGLLSVPELLNEVTRQLDK